MTTERRITNPKLVDLTPTWAEFRGWTVLFDNPSQPIPREHPVPLSADPRRDDEVLYRHLAGLASELESHFAEFPTAWLPPSTYHVTLMDGLSAPHVGRAAGGVAERLARTFAAMPAALTGRDELLFGAQRQLEAASSLAGPVVLQFERVRCRGHAILADLRPDPASAAVWDHLIVRRAELFRALERATGLKLATDLHPHVSLGYFASRDDATRYGGEVTAYAEQHAGTPPPISFVSAGLYGFTSMVDYWRAPEPSRGWRRLLPTRLRR